MSSDTPIKKTAFPKTIEFNRANTPYQLLAHGVMYQNTPGHSKAWYNFAHQQPFKGKPSDVVTIQCPYAFNTDEHMEFDVRGNITRKDLTRAFNDAYATLQIKGGAKSGIPFFGLLKMQFERLILQPHSDLRASDALYKLDVGAKAADFPADFDMAQITDWAAAAKQ